MNNSLRKLRLPVVVLFAAAAAAALAAGCGSSGGTTSGKVVVTDDTGKKLVLAKPADKVVALAPANTEIVYAIGGDKKLAGVTVYCDYPAAAKKKPKVGDFATPNVEKIASLNPQVVLATGGVQAGVPENLSKLGIKVFVVDPKNFAQLFADIKKVGKIMGLEAEADREVAKLQARVKAARAKVKGKGKPKVFIELNTQPLMTAGRKTFIDSIITNAGGKNVGAVAGTEFPEFSEEQLLRDNPDVYVAVKGTQSTPSGITARPGFSGMSAVKNKRVYVVEDNPFVRPGPRVVDALEQMSKMVHPEAYEGGGS